MCQIDVLRKRVGIVGLLVLKCTVHIDVRNANPGIHFALMQTGQQQLIPQLLANAGCIHSILGHAQAQPGYIDLVLARHGLFGLVDGRIVHTNAGLAGHLQLGPVVDHAFQHQPTQLRRWRNRLALLGQLLGSTQHLGAHLTVRDRLGVHHRHNKVRLLCGLGMHARHQQAANTEKGWGPKA